MISKKELKYLNGIGISEESFKSQHELLLKNDSFLQIHKAAVPNDGINIIEEDEFCDIYDKSSEKYRITKFVPASGAATRMFKRLISYHQNPNETIFNEGGFYSISNTFENISKFAFYPNLKTCLADFSDKSSLTEKILYSCLGFAGIPKGLIEFHNYPDGSRTAFEEHLHEAVKMNSGNTSIDIHLTISPEFKKDFEKQLSEIYEKTGITINVSFSFQEKSTDTIAIYDDGSIARNDDNSLLLRPGGHGALLQNLNKLESDIVFIKNIDNLTHGDYLDETIAYKKMLGGLCIDLGEKIKSFYEAISQNNYEKISLENIKLFLQQTFGFDCTNLCDLEAEILSYINRPLRVCGMVKNTGEPGGGPFWVKTKNSVSLQIVEKAQINLAKDDQLKHFNNSTHFNPVDLVCWLKSPKGEKFDLNMYVDKNSSFVSEKTHNGKNIRVLEHPGLWNGAMADWLTVFVEVPLITFNPVKELNDLLREEHQAK